MVPIDFLARRDHYAAHLAPVWLALPEEARGRFVTADAGAEAAARRAGIPTVRVPRRWQGLPLATDMRGRPVVVAGWRDMLTANGIGASIALMPHGIGQSYAGRRGGGDFVNQPGGNDRDMVRLFLHVGGHPAHRDRQRYPGARVETVGSPMLDRLHRKPRDGSAPVVAVATHWCPDVPAVPEAHGSLLCAHHGGWFGIHDAIRDLSRRYEVIGHGHPRLFDAGLAGPMWEGMGIEPVRDFDEVCRRADLLVCDNSSVIYEFAATGRPVVLLDPPWYDRDVGHGIRFWAASHVGPRVGDPRALTDTVTEALRGHGGQWRDREDALDMVFSHRDHAAERAAVTLLDWASERRMAA